MQVNAVSDRSACPCCGTQLQDQDPTVGVDRWQGVPGRFEILTCTTCGAGVTMPQLPEDELGGLYPDGYSPYAPVQGLIGRFYSAVQRRSLKSAPFDAIETCPPGRIVDVGCGRGDLGSILIERGWLVTGVEPSTLACNVCRMRGIDALEGTLATVSLEQGKYDAAVFQHSLEHVTDPVANLELVSTALMPGGVVAIIVPNFDCWERRRFGSRWFHLDLPRHRVHFTPDAMAATIKRAGLEPVSIGTTNSPVGVPGTLQYAVFGRCVFPRGVLLKLAIAYAYLVSPLTRLLSRSVGSGDFLWAVARQPSLGR